MDFQTKALAGGIAASVVILVVGSSGVGMINDHFNPKPGKEADAKQDLEYYGSLTAIGGLFLLGFGIGLLYKNGLLSKMG